MKINGRKLGWAIIHLTLFIYVGFVDFEITKIWQGIFFTILIIFFGWGFIINMERAFK